jgi:hypothetical protein
MHLDIIVAKIVKLYLFAYNHNESADGPKDLLGCRLRSHHAVNRLLGFEKILRKF